MDMNQLMQTFLAESRDLLEDMERHLLEAERGESSPDAVNAIFRAAHTIKGSGGLFDLPQLVGFTHVVESVLDLVRDEALSLSSELIGLLLVCCDHIHALVETAADPSHADPVALAAEAEPLLAQLQTYLQRSACGVTAAAIAQGAPEKQSGYWRITLKLFADALRFGNSPLKLIRNLRSLGSVESINTDISQLPAFDDLDPEANYLGFQILLRSDADRAAIEEVFEFVREDCDLEIVSVPAPSDAADLLTAETAASSAPNKPLAAVPSAASAPGRAAPDAAARNADARSIRVDADKLDRMIDLVGELIIAVSSTNANAQRTGDAQLLESASILAGLVEDVRESALQLRMVKIGGTFSRFQRVVHDVARELGKDIALVVAGEDTELDKSVVEKIGDPLTHLVRNAMDHGIEPADVRVARGKPARGTVGLNAYHDSGSIVIQITDDGGGLNRDRILAKALERGLIEPGRQLSDRDVFAMIFEPGFSTAEKVTNLSGRGVGMDVVKRNITALRGTVEIDSAAGVGTTISVRLPLTLAIINGFQVGVGKSVFVVPLDVVEECVEFTPDYASDYIDLRGSVLPYVRLRELFALGGKTPARESIVVIRQGAQRFGLVVDTLLGEWQTVIKPLSKVFAQVKGISGSSILGSGDVALILDVPSLIQQLHPNQDALAA
ncbi:chemotaxis protein CheA [Xanthomonas citri pv. citri]|uniref:Chemotaxis protein CheA n=3 Tax=Xanthomonas citri TaxID=346 RepID=A0AAI8ETD5_XANAC|nr:MULTISPECIES: chemotaxis protein CheA [Xanthomonas]AAM37710.1 chemotaxis histidine protein kinase [Xanthomonas citri pv. citri str. 306]AGH78351.1 chemotaxis histidine protein kinase [Xanthomonas axonopodis Xac29-1]AGI08925.1 Chemotaxis protein histidine kinase [Xanthomonas citri subsp. citri Aw12879]AJD69460.1 chemotaxis protein histidine kinase-like protein [Xanthomonas citri subsp. citri A306]AJY82980.1 Chemotaxis protein histidine kinase [Xanthomonas citri pv. citri]